MARILIDGADGIGVEHALPPRKALELIRNSIPELREKYEKILKEMLGGRIESWVYWGKDLSDYFRLSIYWKKFFILKGRIHVSGKIWSRKESGRENYVFLEAEIKDLEGEGVSYINDDMILSVREEVVKRLRELLSPTD